MPEDKLSLARSPMGAPGGCTTQFWPLKNWPAGQDAKKAAVAVCPLTTETSTLGGEICTPALEAAIL